MGNSWWGILFSLLCLLKENSDRLLSFKYETLLRHRSQSSIIYDNQQDIMKSSSFKLQLRKCGLSIRQGFWTKRMVRHHDKLLGKAVVALHSRPVCFADPGQAEAVCFCSCRRECRAMLWDLLSWKYHPSVKDDLELMKPVLAPWMGLDQMSKK